MKKYIKKFLFTIDEAYYWRKKVDEAYMSKDPESSLLILGLFAECRTFKHYKTSIYSYYSEICTYEYKLEYIMTRIRNNYNFSFDCTALYKFIASHTYYPKNIKRNLSGPTRKTRNVR